jgi:NinG protein
LNAPIPTRIFKQKKCKVCKEEFEQYNSLQRVCRKFECQVKFALKHAATSEQRRLKESRKDYRQRKLAMKPRGQYLKEVQNVFNRYIRLRDEALPCISCSRFHNGQYHAGHYRTVGSRPELRFCEANVHKQCSVCNNYLSGNLIAYRVALVGRIGLDKVEWLEGNHEAKHYSIDDLKELKSLYHLKCKQLTKELKP